jgi:hypothetical protein
MIMPSPAHHYGAVFEGSEYYQAISVPRRVGFPKSMFFKLFRGPETGQVTKDGT